jgi:hypothetical protein
MSRPTGSTRHGNESGVGADSAQLLGLREGLVTRDERPVCQRVEDVAGLVSVVKMDDKRTLVTGVHGSWCRKRTGPLSSPK